MRKNITTIEAERQERLRAKSLEITAKRAQRAAWAGGSRCQDALPSRPGAREGARQADPNEFQYPHPRKTVKPQGR